MRLLSIICFVCVDLLQTTASWAISYSWKGSVSSQWGNASNWPPAGVPLASDDVTIVAAAHAAGLSADQTVAHFTLASGALLLNGYRLTITGNASFLAGTIGTSGTIGTTSITATGASTVFGTASGGPTIHASVIVKSATLTFRSTTFNGPTTLEKTGASEDRSAGGNIFAGVTSITNSSSSYLTLAESIKDEFHQDVTFTYSGNGPYGLYPSHKAAGNVFNGNIVINSTGNSAAAIVFGQEGGTCSFNGPVNFTAPNLYLNGGTFMQASIFIKTNNVDNGCVEGNVFKKKAKFQCQGTGRLFLAQQFADVVQ